MENEQRHEAQFLNLGTQTIVPWKRTGEGRGWGPDQGKGRLTTLPNANYLTIHNGQELSRSQITITEEQEFQLRPLNHKRELKGYWAPQPHITLPRPQGYIWCRCTSMGTAIKNFRLQCPACMHTHIWSTYRDHHSKKNSCFLRTYCDASQKTILHLQDCWDGAQVVEYPYFIYGDTNRDVKSLVQGHTN